MDKHTLFPIYGMRGVPFWQTTPFYVAIIFLLIVVVGLAIWYGVRKYRKSEVPEKKSWEVALTELADIESLLASKGILGKTFYFRLTWVFKRYLHGRYGFDVYGKTDDELLLYLEGSGLASELVQDLKAIFGGNVFIKFANEQAMKERMQRDLSSSFEFVKKTIPTAEETS